MCCLLLAMGTICQGAKTRILGSLDIQLEDVCIYDGWLISRGGGVPRIASRESKAARFFQFCILQTSQFPTAFSTEALSCFHLCRSSVSLVISTEHSWDLTTSQSSYGSCTAAPFVPCISSPWAGSKLSGCDLLPVPCHSLPQGPSSHPGVEILLCSSGCLGNKLSGCSCWSSGVPCGYGAPRSKMELPL